MKVCRTTEKKKQISNDGGITTMKTITNNADKGERKRERLVKYTRGI